jgi:hypothetical protein
MFKKILSAVLLFLAVDTLPKKDGKSILTEEMKKKLTEKWGEKFVSNFEKDLAEMETNGKYPEDDPEISSLQQQLTDMKTKFENAEKEKKELKENLEKLSKEPEKDAPETIPVERDGKRKDFKPNMAYMHNRVIDAYFRGDTSMMYSGNDTINTTELQQEFGLYVTGVKLDIYKQLTQGLTITQYMKPITTDKTEWRAMQSIITSVLQQFTPKWTPLGKTDFTPIVIKNYFHKVNLPIVPSDIIDQYIGYMYEENQTPDQMPIVKYIVDQLLLPKLLEDLEYAFATAEYSEFKPAADNTPAPENAPFMSMDGVLTILKHLKAQNSKATWLLNGEMLTPENIVDKINEACDAVSPLYRRKKMLIHADPDLIKMYQRAYQKKFPTTKNEDDGKLRVDFTNFSFAPVDGMTGTGAFFITPKENWIHLLSRNPNEARIFLQVENYTVKLFMEFRMSTGFAIEEAIFAYLPQEKEAGLESVGGGI